MTDARRRGKGIARYVDPEPSPPGYVERMWPGTERRVAARRMRRRATGVVAVAAVAAVLFAVGIPGREPAPVWVGASLETGSAASSRRLPDGSVVDVAPVSRLEVDEVAPNEIRLSLPRGRASFDVARRPERRFVVATPVAEVLVVGTKFEVSTEDLGEVVQTRVVVERGFVEVRDGRGTAHRLGAGEEWSGTIRARTSRSPETPLPSVREETTSTTEETSPSRETAASAATPSPPSTGRRTAARLLAEANAARARGDHATALQRLELLVRLHPDDPAASLAMLEIGRIHLRLGDTRAAAEELERAVASDPRAPLREDSLANLVEAYERSGQEKACRAARARYLAEFPGGVRASEVRGRCDSSN